MRHLIASLLLVGMSGVASVASASILISNDATYAYIGDGLLTDATKVDNSGGAVASVNSIPGYSSTTTSSYTSPSLLSAFDQVRGGARDGYAQGFTQVQFTSDVDVPYTAGGTYLASLGGYKQLYSFLFDFATNKFEYISQQDSRGVAAAFTLGGSTGNVSNDFSGSLTGTIVAGHKYQWVVTVISQASPNADSGAEASGSLTLTFGDGAVAPEPISVAVWGGLASVAGFVAVRQRKLAAA